MFLEVKFCGESRRCRLAFSFLHHIHFHSFTVPIIMNPNHMIPASHRGNFNAQVDKGNGFPRNDTVDIKAHVVIIRIKFLLHSIKLNGNYAIGGIVVSSRVGQTKILPVTILRELKVRSYEKGKPFSRYGVVKPKDVNKKRTIERSHPCAANPIILPEGKGLIEHYPAGPVRKSEVAIDRIRSNLKGTVADCGGFFYFKDAIVSFVKWTIFLVERLQVLSLREGKNQERNDDSNACLKIHENGLAAAASLLAPAQENKIWRPPVFFKENFLVDCIASRQELSYEAQ
jgi:hypothetical protein